MADYEDQGFEWEPVQSTKEKVADRPHPITVRLAWLNPLIALPAILIASGSLYTSQSALKISQEATRIGQRSYVSIKQGKMSVVGLDMALPPLRTPSATPIFGVGSLRVELIVVNDGNTPAEMLSLAFKIEIPSRWEITSYQGKTQQLTTELIEVHEGLGRLGPHSPETHKYGWQLTVPEELLNSVLFERSMESASGRIVRPPVNTVRPSAQMMVRDVFGTIEPVEWCWLPSWAGEWPASC